MIKPCRWLVLAVAIQLGACTTYVRRDAPPVTIVSTEELPRIKVRTGGEEMVLHFPRIMADSLVGWRIERPGPGRLERDRIAVPLDQVHAVATERWDFWESGLVAGACVGGFYLLRWWGQRLGN